MITIHIEAQTSKWAGLILTINPNWLDLNQTWPKFFVELGNGSGRVGFISVSNLNGLRISQPEPNPFIKRLTHLNHLTRLK